MPTSSSLSHLICTAYLSRSWTAQLTKCLRTRTRSPCRSFHVPGNLFGRQPAWSKTSAASRTSPTAWRSAPARLSALRRQLRPSVGQSLPEGFRLTERQAEVAKGLLTSAHSLDLVIGVAGSGKTSTLSAVREGFEAAGYKVLGAATSGQAAKALGEGAGVASRTVASLTWRIEHGHEVLSPRHVLVLDEGSMTSDSDVGRLLAAVESSGAKLVTIGDYRQLGSVGPGGALEALVSRHPDHLWTLTDNMRQRDPAERHALDHLRGRSRSQRRRLVPGTRSCARSTEQRDGHVRNGPSLVLRHCRGKGGSPRRLPPWKRRSSKPRRPGGLAKAWETVGP